MPKRSNWHYSRFLIVPFDLHCFTLLVIALDVLGFILGETLREPIYFENPGWLVRIALGFLFLIIAICVVSQFFLWIGMMVWSAFWPGEWIVLRILFVLAQLITLTLGSTLIYIFIYRKQHERAQKVVTARAGVSAS